jgi:hypothetical protein
MAGWSNGAAQAVALFQFCSIFSIDEDKTGYPVDTVIYDKTVSFSPLYNQQVQ